MNKNALKTSFIILALNLLSACSTTTLNDLFQNYNQQMYEAKKALVQGDFQQAINLIPTRKKSDGSYNLHLLEKARLAFLANNNKQSQVDFTTAYEIIQQAEFAAKIEVSRGVENVTAMLSNDNAIRYDVPLYEQSMLHSYQALNYLAQQDLSGALVEVRRANLVQEQALAANKSSIDDYQQKVTANSVDISDVYHQFPLLNKAIGNLKNNFQNAYTFYLSALLYEAVNQNNDAYIDYKKALEIYPDNRYLQEDVWRLAQTLNRHEDIKLLKEILPPAITNISSDTSTSKQENQGQMVFIVENEVVASKQEIAINLPIFTRQYNMRFYSLALPSYENNVTTSSSLTVNYQGNHYQSEEVVRIQALAAKQLKDDLPAILTRQIARLIAKEKAREQLARSNGQLGNIFSSLYNLATEKADTRSWSTLPDNIHILRFNIPIGEQQLMLNINGKNQAVDVRIRPNKITLVKVAVIGNNAQYQTYNL